MIVDVLQYRDNYDLCAVSSYGEWYDKEINIRQHQRIKDPEMSVKHTEYRL